MARYIDKALVDGEHIIARAHYHWVNWLKPGLAVLIPLGIQVAVWTFVEPDHRAWVNYISLGLLALGVLYFLWEFIRMRETEIAVTDRRFIRKTGWISRDTNEIELRSIEESNLKQSILGRLFGYGTLTIRGTGQGIIVSDGIAAPKAFQKAIQAGQSKLRATMGLGPLVPPTV